VGFAGERPECVHRTRTESLPAPKSWADLSAGAAHTTPLGHPAILRNFEAAPGAEDRPPRGTEL